MVPFDSVSGVPCELMLRPTLTFPARLHRRFTVPSVLVATLLAAACRSTTAPAKTPPITADTWAVVNGQEITRDHVEKAYRRTADPSQPLSEEETLTAKLSLLNDLIIQEVLLAKARELKIELPDSELDTAYAEARKNTTEEAFQQELGRRNLTPADMRDGLRRELLTQKVIQREVLSKVAVTDQEVTDLFNANRARFNLAEESFHLAQIVVTPVKDAQIANGTGDDANTPQAAANKAGMLMQRLKEGASFSELAAAYSEDPESAPRGGDLGFVPMSRLKQAPPQLRDAVLSKAPGTVSVVSAGGAHTIVLVVAHEAAGQRDLSTPGVREQLTQTIRGRREQLLRAAYLMALRGDTQMVNYLAKRVVESQGKVPSLAPTAPGAK
jgi:peptidyl-prolyl cis-trans isomerase SurA